MIRANSLILAVLYTATLSLFGANSDAVAGWPDNAFAVKKHDFGTVAVSAKTEFRFPVYNPFNKPLHIKTVRRSCRRSTTTTLSRSMAFQVVQEKLAEAARGRQGEGKWQATKSIDWSSRVPSINQPNIKLERRRSKRNRNRRGENPR